MKKIITFLLSFLFIVAYGQAQIVISEIMYNPPESGSDTLEYIEIHNAGNASVNLEGWSLSGADLIFQAGVSIPAHGYILTAFRSAAMQQFFNVPAIQWTTGNLSNGGEAIRVLNAAGTVVDSVRYDDVLPWPTDAAGNGASVELCNLTADNADVAFWKAATHSTGVTINGKVVLGTPGTANTVSCATAANQVVTVQNFFFAPADVTIQQGQTVRWDALSGTHNVNGSLAIFPSNPEGFTSGAATAAPWFFAYTFNIPGIYSYRCDPHANSGMVGKVTVLPTVASKVTITEISYNDPGLDSLEYVELYNSSTAAVDMSAWTFTQGIEYVFPAGATLAAGQYVVLARFPDYFAARFGFTPLAFTGQLANVGEDIELRDAANNVVDYVDYKPSGLWDAGANGGGGSLVLCDYNSDNNIGSNWRVATTITNFSINGLPIFGNPNAESNCPNTAMVVDDNYGVEPGGSINMPVLSNDFVPGTVVVTMLIISSPTHGTAILNSNNSITYTGNTNYCGTDQLKYRVCASNQCDTGVVNITFKCYRQHTIPQITGINSAGVADSVGIYCQVSATVHGVNLRPTGLQFDIIDGQNNGLWVFNDTKNFGYTVAEGDIVIVKGQLEQFNGLTQMALDTVIKVSSSNPLVTPLTSTKATEGTEAKLVKFFNLHLVDPAQWTTGMGNGGFTAFAVSDDHPNDTIQIRVDKDITLYNEPVPNYPFNLTAIGGQFDGSSPYTSGYQVYPRYTEDLDLLIGTHAADFSAQVFIAPNPAENVLYIRSNLQFDKVQIVTSTGSLVKTISKPSLEETLDIERLARGLYFIRFEKEGAYWTSKFVKI